MSKAECKRCEFYTPIGEQGKDWFMTESGYFMAMKGANCAKKNFELTPAIKDKVDAEGCDIFKERA